MDINNLSNEELQALRMQIDSRLSQESTDEETMPSEVRAVLEEKIAKCLAAYFPTNISVGFNCRIEIIAEDETFSLDDLEKELRRGQEYGGDHSHSVKVTIHNNDQAQEELASEIESAIENHLSVTDVLIRFADCDFAAAKETETLWADTAEEVSEALHRYSMSSLNDGDTGEGE